MAVMVMAAALHLAHVVDGGGRAIHVHTAANVVYFALVCSGMRALARTKWLVSGTNIVSFAMKHLTSAFGSIVFSSMGGFGTRTFFALFWATTKILFGCGHLIKIIQYFIHKTSLIR
tara:strand:- start:340 stop:690 length:351 start_codon:yes stop_codon:yes gene_type:complete